MRINLVKAGQSSSQTKMGGLTGVFPYMSQGLPYKPLSLALPSLREGFYLGLSYTLLFRQVRGKRGWRAQMGRADWLLALALVTAIVLAYLPVWRAGFIWDDDIYVTENPLLTAPDGLRRIWFSLDSPSQYFPLTYTTFYLERALWGFNPAGYHWVNLLLHAANALLVWRLLARLRVPGAWLAAAHLRAASGAGGIGRLDHRAQERADGFFLFAVAAGVDRVHG